MAELRRLEMRWVWRGRRLAEVQQLEMLRVQWLVELLQLAKQWVAWLVGLQLMAMQRVQLERRLAGSRMLHALRVHRACRLER